MGDSRDSPGGPVADVNRSLSLVEPPAQIEPSTDSKNTEPSGQSAPDFGVSGDDGDDADNLVSPPAQTEPAANDQQPTTDNRVDETPGAIAPGIRVSDGEEGDDGSDDNLIHFPAPEKARRGRKRKDMIETYRVEHVKPSRNTWCFCIRWTEADGRRPVVYASRVTDKLFKAITRSKTTYAAFKKSLIASYLARAVRPGDGSVPGPDRAVRDSSARQ